MALAELIDSLIAVLDGYDTHLFIEEEVYGKFEVAGAWSDVCDIDAKIGAECLRLGIETPKFTIHPGHINFKPFGATCMPHLVCRTDQVRDGRRVFAHWVMASNEWRQAMRILAGAAMEQQAPHYDPVNAERDKWLYEQRQTHRKTWNAIHSEFKRCRAKRSWQAIGLNGIRTAVARYAKAKKEPLWTGTGGRPKAPN